MAIKENFTTIAYRYDPENYYYVGETRVQFLHGRLNLPDNTTLKKPPKTQKGSVPVFNQKQQEWNIVEDRDIKLFKRANVSHFWAIYQYSEFKSSTEIPVIYPIQHPNNIGDPTVIKIGSLLSSLSTLDRYISWFSATLMFAIRLDYLNKKIQKLYQSYSQKFKLSALINIANPVNFESFNYEIVEIIHGVKKLLDIIVIAKYLDIEAQGKRLDASSFFEFDGLGEMLKNDRQNESIKKKTLRKQIRKCMYFDQYVELYRTINDAHNAFKHDILSERTINQVFVEPALDVYKFKNSKNNLENILHYRIALRKVIWALNDLFDALFNNLPNNKVVANFKLIQADTNSNTKI